MYINKLSYCLDSNIYKGRRSVLTESVKKKKKLSFQMYGGFTN